MEWLLGWVIILILGIIGLYMAARLVFYAWLKTKENFTKGGREDGKEKQTKSG